MAMAEDVIVFALGADDALKAADQEQGYTRRNQDRQGVSVDRKPMENAVHIHIPPT